MSTDVVPGRLGADDVGVNGEGVDAVVVIEGEEPQADPIGDDLDAAANFLAERSNDDGLLDRIKAAVNAKDGMLATSEVVKGFVKALAVGASPEEEGGIVEVNLEGCVQVVLSLIKEVCFMNAELVEELSTGLSAASDFGDMRLRSIVLLYNSVSEDKAELRFKLLMQMIDLATKVGKVEKLYDVFSNLDKMIKAFNLDVSSTRALYGKVCDSLSASGATERAYRANVARLATYQGGGEADLNAVTPHAITAVCDAIRLPSLFRFDSLLDLDAVKNIQQDKENGDLYKLLEIFVQGNLEDYRKFHADHASVLESMKLDHEACVSKMRLLTFASLGTDRSQLEYAAIAKALEVNEDEVEKWVIKAISSGLINAKMNQVTRSVTVSLSTSRFFSNDNWQQLNERISMWRQNVDDLLDVYRKAQHEI